MLTLEFIRSIKNRTFLYLFFTMIFAYALGYILPVGIDKVNHLSLGYFYFSTYTVLTQFGFLLSSFVIVYCFNRDFSEQTVLFYRCQEISLLRYFYSKILVLLVEFIVSLVICQLVVSLLLGYSSTLTWESFFLYLFVILQYLLIISTCSILLANLLMAIGASLFYWIATIILVNIGGIFKWLAPFDASNSLYSLVEKSFDHNSWLHNSAIFPLFIYLIVLAVISLGLLLISRKRWLINGL